MVSFTRVITIIAYLMGGAFALAYVTGAFAQIGLVPPSAF